MANLSRSRKSGVFLRGGVQRRETLWIGGGFVRNTVVTASTAVLIGSFGTDILAIRPFTIVRVRGVLGLSSDQTANSESQEVSMGFAVVTEQAEAIGVTAVPTPVTDDGSDAFFVFESLMNQMLVSSAIGILDNPMQTVRYDSKAMRKVEDGFDLAQTIETGPNGTGQIVTDVFRMLIKLH